MADSPKISFADFITVAANLDASIATNNRAAVGAPLDEVPVQPMSREKWDEREAAWNRDYKRLRAERLRQFSPEYQAQLREELRRRGLM